MKTDVTIEKRGKSIYLFANIVDGDFTLSAESLKFTVRQTGEQGSYSSTKAFLVMDVADARRMAKQILSDTRED